MYATSGSTQFSIQSFLFKLYFNFALALLHLLSKFRCKCRCNHFTPKIITTTVSTVITDVRQTIYSVSCCRAFDSENRSDMLVGVFSILQWYVWGILFAGILFHFTGWLMFDASGQVCGPVFDSRMPIDDPQDEPQHCPENSGNIHPVTRRNIPDELKIQTC